MKLFLTTESLSFPPRRDGLRSQMVDVIHALRLMNMPRTADAMCVRYRISVFEMPERFPYPATGWRSFRDRDGIPALEFACVVAGTLGCQGARTFMEDRLAGEKAA